jgi:hypothetical protein
MYEYYPDNYLTDYYMYFKNEDRKQLQKEWSPYSLAGASPFSQAAYIGDLYERSESYNDVPFI